jgi:hypothetical protein
MEVRMVGHGHEELMLRGGLSHRPKQVFPYRRRASSEQSMTQNDNSHDRLRLHSFEAVIGLTVPLIGFL